MHSIQTTSRARPYSTPLQKLFVFLVLAIVAIGDYATGWKLLFNILYLVPPILAIATVSYSFSILVAAIASGVRLVIMLKELQSVPISFWNAGVLFATILAICTLLKHIKLLKVNYPTLRIMGSTISTGLGIALALGTFGLVMEAVKTQ